MIALHCMCPQIFDWLQYNCTRWCRFRWVRACVGKSKGRLPHSRQPGSCFITPHTAIFCMYLLYEKVRGNIHYLLWPPQSMTSSVIHAQASTNLSNCDLSSANLSGADLSGCTADGADFTGTDLSGATLSGCPLNHKHNDDPPSPVSHQ